MHQCTATIKEGNYLKDDWMRSIKDYPRSPTYAGSRGYTATRYVKQNAFNTLRDIDAAKGKKKIKFVHLILHSRHRRGSWTISHFKPTTTTTTKNTRRKTNERVEEIAESHRLQSANLWMLLLCCRAVPCVVVRSPSFTANYNINTWYFLATARITSATVLPPSFRRWRG